MPPSTTDALTAAADRARAAGLERIHLIAWRDREHPEAGGSEVHASQVAGHWANAGFEVTLRTGAVPGQPATTMREGVRVVRHGGRTSVIPRTVAAEVLHRDGPRDGLVEIFHGFSFLAPMWATGPRIGVVHHVHLGAWRLQAPLPAAAVGHLLERFVVPRVYRSTLLAALSPSTREELVDLGLPADQVRIAPPGVDDRFTPSGGRSPTPLIAAVGRLMPQKGVDVALRVFAAVHRDHPDARLEIVGDGPAREDLEALADSLGLDGVVTFAGRVDDAELLEVYRRAWLVLNGSRREGWGMTLTEAGACGTPAVASAISGHVDAVIDGTTGLLAADEPGLADAVRRLLDDPDERRRLGAAAADRAKDLRWDAVAATLLDTLAEDAERRGRNHP
jgi:glycosyltransferase involved in cell wall biosynthesis